MAQLIVTMVQRSVPWKQDPLQAVSYRMKETTPLRKLMENYCSRQGLHMDEVRFMVAGRLPIGRFLQVVPNDTPEGVGLKHLEYIHVQWN